MTKLLNALRAAGESTRLRILSILRDNELTVSELTEILGQSQPRVSRHLKLLCDAGLLHRYQEGAWVFHRIMDTGKMEPISRGLMALVDPSEGIHGLDQQKLIEIKQKNAQQAAEYFRLNAQEWDSIRQRTVADAAVEKKLTELVRGMDADLLLDIGTGTGRMLEIFAPHVRRGIGVDQSREMLILARANLDAAGISHCTVHQDDINDLSLDSRSADVVTIHQVLHYLDNPEHAVSGAARILRPGGMLLIVDFLPHQLEFLREKHAHRRLGFSNQTVRQWCRKAGLVIHGLIRLPAGKSMQAETLTVGLWHIEKPREPTQGD